MDYPNDDPLYEPPRPTLPDISMKLVEVERQVAKAKTIDLKIEFIDYALAELTDIKNKGWDAFRLLTGKNRLDNPDPFLDYAILLDRTSGELVLLRQRTLLAEAERIVQTTKPNPPEPKAPVFASPPTHQPESLEPASPARELMNVEELAAYWGRSASWIYKHYEEEGIPFTNVGGLSILKSSFDAWLKAREPNTTRE